MSELVDYLSNFKPEGRSVLANVLRRIQGLLPAHDSEIREQAKKEQAELTTRQLKELQWVASGNEEPDYCPACYGLYPSTIRYVKDTRRKGHRRDCWLAAAIATLEEKNNG